MKTGIRLPAAALLAAAWLAGAAPALAKVESTADGLRFTYKNAGAQQVSLAGDFNGWDGSAQPMARSGDTFTITVKLAPGDHEYKFVVDGEWCTDADNPTTIGSYGNSGVRVGAKGEIVAMEATSNTSLSPKVLLGGRYIGLLIGREDDGNQNRFSVARPDFNIDLDLKVRMSEALDAKVLTKIRNAAQNTPLWETSLEFDRGHLDLHRPAFTLRLFDNDAVGAWDDPLHLLGDIGKYHHEFGFAQQGLRAQAAWRGFSGTLLYADNFRAGDPQAPVLDTLKVATPGLKYGFNLTDSNKNVLALRLEREMRPGVRIGASLRNDRGYNPGTLSRVQAGGDSTRQRDTFGRTFERWTGGGLDLRASDAGGAWEGSAEILYGEASIGTGMGVRQTFHGAGASWARRDERPLEAQRIALDTSQRWIVAGRLTPVAGLVVRAALESERHGLAAAATDSLRSYRNAARVYRGGFEVGLRERLQVPVRAGADLELFSFDYSAEAPWNTQLWFADRNFWMEHSEHQLPVARYVQLGGSDATTWSPWLEWTVLQGPPLVLRYEGHFYGGALGERAKLIESLFKISYPVTKRLRLYSDTRWARYHDRVLEIDRGYLSTFAEIEYQFAAAASVAFSWGVDPFILDVATNEYAAIGRNEFLIARGATPNVARDFFLSLRSRLPRAEKAMEDERRVQVEAIVRF